MYAFLLQHIDSLEQLEVLLLLRRLGKAASAPQVAAELRIQPDSTRGRLENLSSRGLLEVDVGNSHYRYAPRTPELDQAVSGLATAYAERRVTVINLIATKHLERIRTFADAFKLRGE